MINFKYQTKCGLCKKIFSTKKEHQLYCDDCEEKIKRSKKEESAKLVSKKSQISNRLISPKLGYKFELFSLSRKTINKFVFLDNRRKISQTQIASLRKCLYNGKHFDSPIVVNEIEGMFRIVDGNHRITAFKTILNKNPKFNIDILLIIYNNLDKDGEIEAFRKWNVGKMQSTDDFIQSIAHKIEFIRWVKNSFPIEVTIYKTIETLGIRLLCGSLISAKNSDDTGYGLKRDSFLRDIETLTEKDYEFAKKWVNTFKDIFGYPKYRNPYYSTTFFTAYMYIAYEFDCNDKLIERLKERVLGNEEILKFAKFGGREGNRAMIRLIKDKIQLKPAPLIR